MQAITAEVTAYGICVFTWSTWSDPEASDDSIVVSESGEQ